MLRRPRLKDGVGQSRVDEQARNLDRFRRHRIGTKSVVNGIAIHLTDAAEGCLQRPVVHVVVAADIDIGKQEYAGLQLLAQGAQHSLLGDGDDGVLGAGLRQGSSQAERISVLRGRNGRRSHACRRAGQRMIDLVDSVFAGASFASLARFVFVGQLGGGPLLLRAARLLVHGRRGGDGLQRNGAALIRVEVIRKVMRGRHGIHSDGAASPRRHDFRRSDLKDAVTRSGCLDGIFPCWRGELLWRGNCPRTIQFFGNGHRRVLRDIVSEMIADALAAARAAQ